MSRRVVITGLGTVNPLGKNVEEYWENIKANKLGLSFIDQFDASDFPVKIVGAVKDFDAGEYIDKKEAKRLDRFTQFAVVAAKQALAQAGSDFSDIVPYRAGVIIGVGVGGLNLTEQEVTKFNEKKDKVSVFFIPMMIIKDTSDNSQYDDIYLGRDGQVMVHDGLNTDYAVANYVDGATLQNFKQHKGFYREINHGREVEVGEIRVDKEADGKYKMTAVIDGQSITHEITQKQYDKFLAVDDYQRMKLFSKIFDEVDIKTRPGEGTNFGAALLAALVSTGEVLADPMWNHRGPGPEIYRNQMPGNVYYKPGVVSPSEVAAANFESLDRPERSYGESRGMGM